MSALIDELTAYGCKIEQAMGRFLHNEDFYAKCFGKFVEDKNFAALGAALQAGDAKAAFDAVHDLKGTSSNMGITPIYTLIAGLVEAFRQGEIPADAEAVYEKLLQMQVDLKKIINK